MFTPQACHKNQFKTINRFDKSSIKWETSDFYPNKHRNVHKCELRYFGGGMLLQVLNSFMDFVNATKVKVEVYESTGNSVNVEVYGAQLGEKIPEYVFGNIYWFDTSVFFIPPGELYTPFEKMFLPFEDELWIANVVTLSIGFVTIKIVNFTIKKVKSFVFGRDVKSPTINYFGRFTSENCWPKLCPIYFYAVCHLVFDHPHLLSIKDVRTFAIGPKET
jgi:hypothetical protein